MGIFGYVGLEVEPSFLSFDDYMLCVCTLAAMTRDQLISYAFGIFDKDQSGMDCCILMII
jgi:hypothetical protein